LSGTTDPVLNQNAGNEIKYIDEVIDDYSSRVAVSPWIKDLNIQGDNLKKLFLVPKSVTASA
jgi:hypothetical protein